MSSIFLLRIVHCTGCTGICLSVSRWLLCSHRRSTVLVNRLASVEGHPPFPMRHPPVRQIRRQLCDILCPPVRQTRTQLCDILCPPVRQIRMQLCHILCPPVRQIRRQLCDIPSLPVLCDFLFPLARRRLCTALASSPSSRARLRVRVAEFGAESATPEFSSASALRRQEPYH